MLGHISDTIPQIQEEIFWSIFQTMAEGFALHEIVCDEYGETCDLCILNINPAFELLTGLKRKDIVGRTFSQVLPDDDPGFIKILGAVAAAGKPAKFESYSRTIGRYYDIVAFCPFSSQVATLFIDITDRKKLESKLAISEARSRAIIESIPDQILIIADDGTLLDCRSSPNAKLCLASSEFLPGRRIDDIFPLEFADKIKMCMNEARESHAIQLFDYRHAADGLENYYEVRVALSLDNVFVAFIRDIAKLKKMEMALLESERRFQAAIDNFPNAFIIYDQSLRIRYINRAGLLMCGMSEDEVLDHTDEELFSSGITDSYMPNLRKTLDTGTMQTVKSVQNSPAGRAIIVFNYVPILNEQGEIWQILGINFDVTELEVAKRRLEVALAENQMQNRFLRTSMEDLSENYKNMEKLLYKISRDLIVPLSTVEGFLELLEKDIEKSSRIRIDIDIGLIADAISRMQALVGDALELSVLGISTEASYDFTLSEVMDDVLKHFEKSIASGSLKITVDRDFPAVHANRRRIADVLISIIDGCIKCFEGGAIPALHIGHFTEEDGCVFVIRSEDKTGHRAPKDIFSKGSQEDLNLDLDSGFTGLVMAKRMVEAQGGRIWIESEAEAGCSILFTLPMTEKKRV